MAARPIPVIARCGLLISLLCAAALPACGGGAAASDAIADADQVVAQTGAAPLREVPAAAQIGCPRGRLPTGSSGRSFELAQWPDRGYDLELPPSYRCGTPLALVVVFHGGGGNKNNMRPLTCPDGDTTRPGCLDRSALTAGMAIVFANGSNARGGKLLSPGGLRTWNAGGGTGGYNCASGSACSSGVDDVAYTRALLADIASHVDVDSRRVYATGFSNGAALAQRLACEAAELFAAIAPVAGENQFALAGCAPVQRVAVLDIHGTADRCWPYAGGNGGCIENGLYVSVGETMAGWAARNGCSAEPIVTTLPPRPGVDDGTSVIRHAYSGCGAGGALEHLEVVGNGHYWPDGQSYASGRRLGGVMSRQLETGPAIVEFFAAHARP